MNDPVKKVEELYQSETFKEVELMLTEEELRAFAQYCSRNSIKFNDWIRQLAHTALENEQNGSIPSHRS